MYTFKRNNRECIHKLAPNSNFVDFTDTDDFYLVNDALNLSHIKTEDLVKFNLVNSETGKTERVYGFIVEIVNIQQSTFMICRHYDEMGRVFYLDYVYSSFHHAFKRLNQHGSFSDWNQLTHIKGAHAPSGFIEYWMSQHVTTECTTECPEYNYNVTTENNAVSTSTTQPVCCTIIPGYDVTQLHLRDSQLDDDIYWR